MAGRRIAAVAASAALLGLLATGAPTAAAGPVGSELLPSGPAWESSACVVDIPPAHVDRVTCGSLTVPEVRGAPAPADGGEPRTIQLPVAIIATRALRPAPDPLVFPTTGGPGGGSLDALWYFLDHAAWAGDRDIVVVEQRGDRRAKPTLDCPELAPAAFFVDGVRLRGDAAQERHRRQLQACHDRLVDSGIDLSAYTSAASAADLVDLRAALGYDQWNLYGISYGSRLALTVMRDAPTGLRSVILDGPLPPDVDRLGTLPSGFLSGLGALGAACRADADCRERYPQLQRELVEVLDRAQETPIPVTVKSPVDRTAWRVDLTDHDLARGLFDALYSPESIRALPLVIDEVAHGDTDPLVPLAQQSLDGEARLSEGLNLSIECAEQVPFMDAAAAASAAAHPVLEHLDLAAGLADDCALWGVPPADERERAPVVSDIPTLIAVGGFDPVTPLPYAEAAAAGLSHSFLYEFPPAGHGAIWTSGDGGCAASIAAAFLTDPAVAPDAACIAGMAPPDFVTTADVHPMSAFARIDSDLLRDGDPVQLGVAVLLLLTLALTLGYAVVVGLRPGLRARGVIPEGVVLPATASAALNVVFAGALALILVNAPPLVLGFGLPAGAWPLLILPWMALAAALLAGALLARAWLRTDGVLWHRIVLTIATAACLGTAVWLLARGLLTF